MNLIKFSNNIYYMNYNDNTDRPTIGYIKGTTHSLAIDAGNSKEHVDLFYHSLEKEGLKKPNYTVLTHYHWDHTFGMHAIHGLSIVCAKTNEKLTKMKHWIWSDIPMKQRVLDGLDTEFSRQNIVKEYPNLDEIQVVTGNLIFEKELTIDLGGIHCVLKKVTAPHTDDCVLIYIPEEKVLFVGDADCENSLNKETPYDKNLLTTYIETLKNIDFTTYILGHDEPETKENAMLYLQTELSKL